MSTLEKASDLAARDSSVMFVFLFQELADGKTLKVTDIKTTDGGRYTCMATNVAGQMEKTFKVIVQGKDYAWIQ